MLGRQLHAVDVGTAYLCQIRNLFCTMRILKRMICVYIVHVCTRSDGVVMGSIHVCVWVYRCPRWTVTCEPPQRCVVKPVSLEKAGPTAQQSNTLYKGVYCTNLTNLNEACFFHNEKKGQFWVFFWMNYPDTNQNVCENCSLCRVY